MVVSRTGGGLAMAEGDGLEAHCYAAQGATTASGLRDGVNGGASKDSRLISARLQWRMVGLLSFPFLSLFSDDGWLLVDFIFFLAAFPFPSTMENDSFTDGFFKRKFKSSVSPKSDGTNKKLANRIKVLDPQGPVLQKWNKIFVITCVMAISVDPLFFYVPVINDKEKCLNLDTRLKITVCVLRTFFDLFYILRISFQFRTGFIAPSSRVFGRGELIDDIGAIVKRYLSSDFIIDILSIIPLPQVVIMGEPKETKFFENERCEHGEMLLYKGVVIGSES